MRGRQGGDQVRRGLCGLSGHGGRGGVSLVSLGPAPFSSQVQLLVLELDPLPSPCPRGAPQPLPLRGTCLRGRRVPVPRPPEKALQEKSVPVQKTCIHLLVFEEKLL